MKYAVTFGGSEFIQSSQEYIDGILLGKYLAMMGYTVKNGGYYGLMEAVSRGVAEVGGECIGITNASFRPKLANCYISTEIEATDVFDRLRLLIKDTELFVVQKGSIGTVEELLATWCLRYTLTRIDIRICLIGNFWHKVLDGFRHLNIRDKEFEHLSVFKDVHTFINAHTSGVI